MYFRESCIFAEFPLDPCDHKRKKITELERLMFAQSSRYLIFKNGEALMCQTSSDQPVYVTHSSFLEFATGEVIFLGENEERAYFAFSVNDIDVDKLGGEFHDLRSIGRSAANNGFSKIPSLLARGKMLLDWHERHQYCAACGAKSESRNGGYIRHCFNCETDHFPRVDPVVIMMVLYEDKCLLGRSPHFLPGMYSALAGFMEPGETIEEAVRREVYEEAGIKVGKVNYIKSQPWPFPSSLMIGVTCEALGDDIKIDPIELEDARWFDKEQIKKVLDNGGNDQFRVPEKLAIARHLLEVHLLENWIRE